MPYVLLEKPDASKEPLVTASHVEENIKDGHLRLHNNGLVISIDNDGHISYKDPDWNGDHEWTEKTPKGNYAYHGGRYILMAV